jgi:hypothetical protein
MKKFFTQIFIAAVLAFTSASDERGDTRSSSHQQKEDRKLQKSSSSEHYGNFENTLTLTVINQRVLQPASKHLEPYFVMVRNDYADLLFTLLVMINQPVQES